MGSAAGDQIKVRAKVGANAVGDGYLVSQKGTKKFKVNVGGDIGICTLVDKDSPDLLDDEMIINVLSDGEVWRRATKLYNRTAIVAGQQIPWNFSSSLVDGAVQMPDEAAIAAVIIPGVIAGTLSVTAPATVTMTITPTSSPSGTITDFTYQWQRSDNGGVDWTNVGTDSNTFTTPATTVLDDNDDQYKVTVGSAGSFADSVDSAAVTLAIS